MQEFTYDGVPLHKLEPVHKIKDLDKQVEEIERRLEALLDFSIEKKTLVTPLHMRNVLAISDATFTRWMRGVVADKNKKDIIVETSKTLSAKEKELIRLRSDILKKWLGYGKQWCIDDIAITGSSGNIYLGKSVYHMWDKPQEKKDNKIGVEVLVREAAKK